ncbi:hypothetical protein [Streptomyces chartreusis]
MRNMRATMRKAGRATVHLLVAAAMAFGMYLFITVLLITAVGTLAVIGCGLLPETVILLRRIAGAKQALTAPPPPPRSGSHGPGGGCGSPSPTRAAAGCTS